ncbi:Pr6Pr family membrane protein [Microbacterium stercoris]|uniref:Pr6Pr family membrane protein n=1 Tax=Microbacterium stercoris TaxID=2820289 RepID=A0A939QLM4_9MICO|nr:Pr6Pr family membrane protein [Microbacterium stercoris]MBO3664959.1 Pr6Pr family membrane protein [Microbacterium stercoris]
MRRPIASPRLWFACLLIVLSIYGFMVGSHSTTFLTTITNAILLGYLVVGVWTMWTRGTDELPAPRLRGAIVTWMLFVAIIAHSLLSHWANPFDAVFDPDPAASLRGTALLFAHYVMPIGMLLDWLLFGPRGRTRWIDIAIWPLYALAYGLLTILRAVVFPDAANAIPYPFLEPGDGGWGQVIVLQFPIVIAVALVAAPVIAYDKLLARAARAPALRLTAPEPVADKLSP